MHIFGLTGGIACGKSTVAARFRSRRLPVIDADVLAREVVQEGTEGLQAVVETFGPSVLDDDGLLDRKKLARLAFSDKTALAKLNAILHPLIRARTVLRTSELSNAGEPLSCYEAALLVETGVAAAFRPLVVVACSEDVQLARIRTRDELSAEDALARIRAQKPLAEKIAVADFVIDTGGTVEASASRSDEVLAGICAQFGVDVGRYPLPP